MRNGAAAARRFHCDLRAARRSGRYLEMHPGRRAEPGLDLPAGDETGLFIEGKRMWVRGDLDPAGATLARDRDQVLHQRTPGALRHPLRIDEQILKLDHIPGAEPGGEADDATVSDRGPRASLTHCEIGELESVGMGEQVRPVTVIGQR